MSRSKVFGIGSGLNIRIREAEWKGRIELELPSILLSNFNRLHNKVDELETLLSHQSADKLLHSDADRGMAD